MCAKIKKELSIHVRVHRQYAVWHRVHNSWCPFVRGNTPYCGFGGCFYPLHIDGSTHRRNVPVSSCWSIVLGNFWYHSWNRLVRYYAYFSH